MTVRFTNNDLPISAKMFIYDATSIEIDGKTLDEIRADERAKTIDEFIEVVLFGYEFDELSKESLNALFEDVKKDMLKVGAK